LSLRLIPLVVVLHAAAGVADELPAVVATPDTFEVEGVVHDSDGNPVPEAQLALRSSAGVVQSTDTDQEGRFRLPDVPPGQYTIDANSTGFAAYHHPVEVSGDVHGL